MGLKERIKNTFEEKRIITRLLRVIKNFFSYLTLPNVFSFASKKGKKVLTILKRVIPLTVKRERMSTIENTELLKDNALDQSFDDILYRRRQTHVMLCTGWEQVAFTVRREVEHAGLEFVSNLELALTSSKELPHGQWAAISHVPTRLPQWMAVTKAYKPFITVRSKSKAWKRAKGRCQRLFAFSEDHASILEESGLTSIALKHPLPEVTKKWSWEAFENNSKKEIIQVGWWLARMHAIYLLPESSYKKIWIRRPGQHIDEVFGTERDYLKRRFMFFDHMDSTVNVLDDLPMKEYKELLCANIAFVHYYDVSAPNLILECIVRHTPILVNALPAVREYLGDDYPFYYYFYEDAVGKATDLDVVHKTHEYLKALSKKMDVSLEGVALQVRKSLEEKRDR